MIYRVFGVALRSLNKGVGSAGGDSAHVDASGHLDVALVAPLGGPAVLDEEVVLAVLGAVADGQHAVVEGLGGAVGLVVHAWFRGEENCYLGILQNWTILERTRLDKPIYFLRVFN